MVLERGSIATFRIESVLFRFLSTFGETFTGETTFTSFSGLTMTLGGVFGAS